MKLACIFKREMKTGRHSMIMHFLFPYANRIILYAHNNMWPRIALAVSRLDAPMCLITSMLIYWLFLWSPFIAPWHRSRARALAMLLLAGDLGDCQARAWLLCHTRLPGLAATTLCCNRHLFLLSPLCGDHSAQVRE